MLSGTHCSTFCCTGHDCSSRRATRCMRSFCRSASAGASAALPDVLAALDTIESLRTLHARRHGRAGKARRRPRECPALMTRRDRARILSIACGRAHARVEIFGVAVPLVGGGFRNAYLTKTVQKAHGITAASGATGPQHRSVAWLFRGASRLAALRGVSRARSSASIPERAWSALARLDGCIAGFRRQGGDRDGSC